MDGQKKKIGKEREKEKGEKMDKGGRGGAPAPHGERERLIFNVT